MVVIFSLVLILLTAGLYSTRFLPAAISPAIRTGLTVLRAVWFVFLVWLFLADPKIVHREQVTLEPILPVVIDDSESMALSASIRDTASAVSSRTKWDTIQEIARDENLAGGLRRSGFEDRIYYLSEFQGDTTAGDSASERLPGEPTLPTTDLAGPLTDLAAQYTEDRCPGFLFFTDGQWNRGGDPLEVGWVGEATPPFRFFTVGIGDPNPPTDFRLTSISAPPSIRSGRMGSVIVHGDAEEVESSAEATLRLELRTADGQIQWATEIQKIFDSGDVRWRESVLFPATEAGLFDMAAQLTTSAEDIDPDNNQVTTGIQILDDRDRILMLTRGPDWDFKLIKRALEQDPFAEVEPILYRPEGPLRLGDRDWVRQESPDGSTTQEAESSSAAASLEDLDRWSLIVLHGLRLDAEQAALRDRIAAYAENGGSILVLPGGFGKFADVYWPFEPAGIQVTVVGRDAIPVAPSTDAASLLAAPVLATIGEDLPPLERVFSLGPPPPRVQPVLAAKVLNEDLRLPLMVEIRHGLGRVVHAYSDTFWRWKMYARQEDRDEFGRFWRVLVHLLAPSSVPSMGRLLVSDPSPQVGEPVEVILELTRDSDVEEGPYRVTVSGPDREMTLALSEDPSNPLRSAAELVPSVSGEYRLRETRIGLEAEFTAKPSREEKLRAAQNTAFLRAMAERTGGEYVENADNWRSLIDRIPQPETVIEREHRRFWASRFWVLCCLIGMLAVEWFVRQRQGLP